MRVGGIMGYYSEYLDKRFDFESLSQERKKQIKKIQELRKERSVLVYASDLNKRNTPISIDRSDLILFRDQVSEINSKKVDIILETPGGSGERVEDIVNLIRGKFEEVSIIIPGVAKSAGTIMAMSADEILMESASALGPIDAQITLPNGKVFSADALLKGFKKIESEVEETGKLNQAYIPMLQGISPGELENAKNAKNFAIKLVKKWLTDYKFRSWNKHSRTSKDVTVEEKTKRAEKIATELSDHSRWLTHSSSITIKDLEEMKLKVVDYSEDNNLHEAINRYYALLQITFHSSIYKLIETEKSQIYRFANQQLAPMIPRKVNNSSQILGHNLTCEKCGNIMKIQINMGRKCPLQRGFLEFPQNNQLKCPNCQTIIELSDLRRQLEARTGQKVV